MNELSLTPQVSWDKNPKPDLNRLPGFLDRLPKGIVPKWHEPTEIRRAAAYSFAMLAAGIAVKNLFTAVVITSSIAGTALVLTVAALVLTKLSNDLFKMKPSLNDPTYRLQQRKQFFENCNPCSYLEELEKDAANCIDKEDIALLLIHDLDRFSYEEFQKIHAENIRDSALVGLILSKRDAFNLDIQEKIKRLFVDFVISQNFGIVALKENYPNACEWIGETLFESVIDKELTFLKIVIGNSKDLVVVHSHYLVLKHLHGIETIRKICTTNLDFLRELYFQMPYCQMFRNEFQEDRTLLKITWKELLDKLTDISFIEQDAKYADSSVVDKASNDSNDKQEFWNYWLKNYELNDAGSVIGVKEKGRLIGLNEKLLKLTESWSVVRMATTLRQAFSRDGYPALGLGPDDALPWQPTLLARLTEELANIPKDRLINYPECLFYKGFIVRIPGAKEYFKQYVMDNIESFILCARKGVHRRDNRLIFDYILSREMQQFFKDVMFNTHQLKFCYSSIKDIRDRAAKDLATYAAQTDQEKSTLGNESQRNKELQRMDGYIAQYNRLLGEIKSRFAVEFCH